MIYLQIINTFQDVGFQWFTTLFDEKRYKEAANLCPQLFGRNKDFWESYIIRFKQFNQLTVGPHSLIMFGLNII